MAKSITEVLGIEYPIIQGAMAWISDAGMAAAVSNAGGAGIISAGGRTTDYVREEIRKAKKLTAKPFGVNVMLMAPNRDEIVQVICEEKPAFVTLARAIRCHISRLSMLPASRCCLWFPM